MVAVVCESGIDEDLDLKDRASNTRTRNRRRERRFRLLLLRGDADHGSVLSVHRGLAKNNPAAASPATAPTFASTQSGGVREVWLVHPTERTLAIYRLESGRYGPATVLELKGRVPLTAVPGVIIDCDRVGAF
jgi:hypothetical protein